MAEQYKMQTNELTEIWGEYTFGFEMEKVEDEGHCVRALRVIALDAVGRSLPLECVWRRVIGDRTYEMEGLAHEFCLSCEDVGAYIYVAATVQGQGTAQARYGPIQINPRLRKNLEYILNSKGSKFNLQYIKATPNGDTTKDEAIVTVTPESLAVTIYERDGTVNKSDSFNIAFTIN